MGCSPSSGQLLAGIYNHQDKALQFGSYESNSHHFSGGTEIKSQAQTETVSSGLSLLQEEHTAVQLQGKRPTVCDIVRASVDIGETQGELLTKVNTDRKDDRKMKNNGCKRSRHRERQQETVYMQSNLDLPQAMVKAHEAAYAYLNHNIPKYESLLGLLEKATQTQLSLQPMVTLLALQYEEINQALDEIATEGEQMLEIHGNRMALPAAQNDVLLNPDIKEAESNSTEGSPDLLQHMLHHLIKKMTLVGDSVKGLGDTSLEETGDYFGTLSQLLAEKLGAKRAAELRLKQVLACVESYALRKLNSEDSALHSEDSGIGVEKECHNGSVGCCSHQESSGSGARTQSSYGCPEGSLPDQRYVNEDENDDDVDKDTDAEDSNDDEALKHEQGSKTDMMDRKISNWSQADPSQYPVQVNLENKRPTNYTFECSDQKERNIRQPKTADDSSVSCHRHFNLWGAKRSRSADFLCIRVNDYMVQGQNRFPNDNQKPEWITKRQNPSQFYCLQDGNNGPFKPGLIPSLTPAFTPVPPGKNAVRRLINTFSQGVCHSSNQKPLIGPKRFRGRKRSFLPIITNCGSGVSTNGNNNSYPLDQQLSERPDNIDVNSLPPPPPEVLMDNSFEKNEGPTGDEYGSETQNQRCSTQRQKSCVSQCPRASMQTVSLLPSQDSISMGSLNISETCPNGQDFVDETHPEQDSDQPIGDKDKDKAIGLFQHSQTINHLCHSTGILANLGPGDEGNIKYISERLGQTVKLGNRDSSEGEGSTLYANSHPPITPPVSRARIPPSSYSTCHRVPSPTALPPSPTRPVIGQGETSTSSFTSQIQTSTRRYSDDANGFMTASSSMSFYDARSVFCQVNQSASLSVKPFCRSTLPRPWGESKLSKERLQATCLPQTFIRSIPYRPTLTDHRLLLPSVTQPHYKDSESTTSNDKRKEYVAETDQCSKQEILVSCSVFGPQEAEANVMDKMD
ncbi:uncharacterized protein pcare2 [Pangasianodon hypophthalmus]|uniref:uncharacterized protein pcare2 n=1 Tax=Pangasianodon hypophthalmus TaxID=310915 RepID=UPI0023077040|nr:uncharacterized protein pcare2 [Pangasianodon hypophthalmus]